MSEKNRSSIGLGTLVKELIKQYFVYDVNNRIIEVYETATDTKHGGPCIRTRYSYDGLSQRVKAMVEEPATWNGSWDI